MEDGDWDFILRSADRFLLAGGGVNKSTVPKTFFSKSLLWREVALDTSVSEISLWDGGDVPNETGALLF